MRPDLGEHLDADLAPCQTAFMVCEWPWCVRRRASGGVRAAAVPPSNNMGGPYPIPPLDFSLGEIFGE
jgi:hypothetical protein